jgi:hypothetical protein
MKSVSRPSANMSPGRIPSPGRHSNSVFSQRFNGNAPQTYANILSRGLDKDCVPSQESENKYKIRVTPVDQRPGRFFLSRGVKPLAEQPTAPKNVGKVSFDPYASMKPQPNCATQENHQMISFLHLKKLAIKNEEVMLNRTNTFSRITKENCLGDERPSLKTITQMSLDSISHYRNFYIKSLHLQASEVPRVKKNYVLDGGPRASSAQNSRCISSYIEQSQRITSECDSILSDKSLIRYTKRKKNKVACLFSKIYARCQ